MFLKTGIGPRQTGGLPVKHHSKRDQLDKTQNTICHDFLIFLKTSQAPPWGMGIACALLVEFLEIPMPEKGPKPGEPIARGVLGRSESFWLLVTRLQFRIYRSLDTCHQLLQSLQYPIVQRMRCRSSWGTIIMAHVVCQEPTGGCGG